MMIDFYNSLKPYQPFVMVFGSKVNIIKHVTKNMTNGNWIKSTNFSTYYNYEIIEVLMETYKKLFYRQ